jgi:hypothetical protein
MRDHSYPHYHQESFIAISPTFSLKMASLTLQEAVHAVVASRLQQRGVQKSTSMHARFPLRMFCEEDKKL